MLEIGHYNLFLTRDYENYRNRYSGYSITGGHMVLSSIINTYDDCGKNCLYLFREDKDSIKSIVRCKSICFNQVTDLNNFLKDNLFRLDIIIVDAFTDIKKNEYLVSTIRNITNLPIILIGEKAYSFTIVDFDKAYSFYRKFKTSLAYKTTSSEYFDNSHVVNLTDNEELTLSDTEKIYIRDMKLESLLKGK